MERPAFTLGVEEEFQIIDPETRELRSHVQEILEEGRLVLKERVKPEMHQSVIEIGSGICKNIQEVRLDVGEMRTEIIRLSKKNGMRVASAGTHPFSNWADQKIFPDPRYDSVVQEMQLLARANLIFGLHVHVGIKDRALAIQIMNEALYFLPAPAGALDELAVLAGPQYRPEELPDEGLRSLSRAPASPSTSRPRRSSTSSSASSFRPTASTTARRSGGTCVRIRSSKRSSSGCATCRCASRRP